MSEAKNEASELMPLLGERYAKALQLRKEGLTYKAVGRQLGVCAQRARQMVLSAKWKLNRTADEWPELSVRARNCLRAKDYNTKEKVMEGIRTGAINPNAKYPNCIPNYGRKTHQEVCDWLGIEIEETDKQRPVPEKTIKRYIAFLERHGYTVTKLT